VSTHVPDELERVAESLADSASLDWSALEREHPELTGTLARLRALERLAAAHRTAGREPAAGPVAETIAVEFPWGPLRVHERLGEGAFGEVYRAHDPTLGRDVALKLRRATAAGSSRAWLGEARRLARVSHPHVLAVLGVGEHGGRAGLWTELVHGETLEARLEREGPLPAREVALVGVDLCRALAAVHAERLVHGDVKTSNVMCERGPGARHPGRIVLMDFGAGQEGPPASPATWTPLVSAPELLRGGEASFATDQYALGVLLYRLLTARWPFDATSVSELTDAAARTAPPLRELRPDVPIALHDAVLRALAREPRHRYENLSALESALAASVEGAEAGGFSRRTMFFLGAVGVVGVLLVGSLIFAAFQRDERRVADSQATTAPRAPVPALPLQISATLLKRTAAGSEPLVDGGVVNAGDRVALDLRASEPVWAYVLNEDATGAAFALFPLAGLEPTNPLSAGAVHRLPGNSSGRAFSWQVGEGLGGEIFLIIASRRARPDIEAQLAQLAQASGTATASGAPPAAARQAQRGVDGLVESEPPRAGAPGAARAGPVSRLAVELARANDPDLWIWRVRATHGRP
jgi:hypothetical protein